jgi:hypothetical protein
VEKTFPREAEPNEGGLNRGEPEAEKIEIKNPHEEGQNLQGDKRPDGSVPELWST